MKYENLLIELFVNQILRTKQIISFLQSSFITYDHEMLLAIFNNKALLSFSDLYDLVSSQLGEEETETYIDGLELLNEYFIVLSISSSLNDKDNINKLKNKFTDESLWSIDSFKYIIEFTNKTNGLNASKHYSPIDNIPLKLKFKFELANLVVLFSSMLSLLHTKKLLIIGNISISFKALFQQIDVDKDGLISIDDISHLLSKHKVNFPKDDIKLIFLLNKMPEKVNSIDVNNVNTFVSTPFGQVDFFDYKTFKGFLYIFGFNRSSSHSKLIHSRDQSRSKSPIPQYNNNDQSKKQSSMSNVIIRSGSNMNIEILQNDKKLNFPSLRFIEQIISLAKLEENLENQKIDYISNGELSLIHLFQCFDLSNNDYIVEEEFLASLEYLGIADIKIGSSLFSSYAIEDRLAYIKFVELMLPNSPEKAIKLSRKTTNDMDYFNKINFYQNDNYQLTKAIMKNILNIHISIQRQYIQLREQILLDKNIDLNEVFRDIHLHGKRMNDDKTKDKDLAIHIDDVRKFLQNTANYYDYKDECLLSIFVKINPSNKSGIITPLDFKRYFCL